MQASSIDYKHTGYFSKTVTDYLANANHSAFYKYQPTLNSFSQIIADKSKENIDRKTLVDVLKKQYKTLGEGAWTEAIESLQNENTFTVTTGHQLCLFTGPLYFIYKIITTINLAEVIEKANPGYKIVPIYWMATEDHDFAEINHINLFGKHIEWQEEIKGATGKLNTAALQQVLEELNPILGESDKAKELTELFTNAYLKHTTLADATRYLANELFGKYGLVIIDADEPALKKKFAPIIKKDILDQHSHRLIAETNAELEKAGINIQVNPREINFFYLEDNLRERIAFENGKYQILNTNLSFSKEELEQEIENHPEKFSPNVVMRPLYQDLILPNLAYIGGGAEVNYWMELKSVFDHYQVNFPALVLRNSALVVDEVSHKRLEHLNLTAKDLFTDTNKLINCYVKQQSSNELNLDAEIAKFEKVFEQIELKTQSIDPTLIGSVEAEKTKFFSSLKGLEHKLSRAEKKKFEQQTTQIIKLKEKLFPNGTLQERHDNFIPFYLKHGEGFISMLKDHFDPLDFKFTIL